MKICLKVISWVEKFNETCIKKYKWKKSVKNVKDALLADERKLNFERNKSTNICN